MEKKGEKGAKKLKGNEKDCLPLLEKVLLHGTDRCAHVLSSCGMMH